MPRTTRFNAALLALPLALATAQAIVTPPAAAEAAATEDDAAQADAASMHFDGTVPDKPAGAVRIATFNASLFNDKPKPLSPPGQPLPDRVIKVIRIIEAVRPDIVLINEVDNLGMVARVRAARREGGSAITHVTDNPPVNTGHIDGDTGTPQVDAMLNATGLRWLAIPKVNTGVPVWLQYGPVPEGMTRNQELDVNGDGEIGTPADAQGWGEFPGQYGMMLLSRFELRPLDDVAFAAFRWSLMPDNRMPPGFYSEPVANNLRLSSKNHVDMPVTIPAGVLGEEPVTLHVLMSHPTPPVFDGEEDRNGHRQYDEIRLWAEYITPAQLDDAGRPDTWLHGYAVDEPQSLPADAHFVILGDMNADPADGDSLPGTMRQLLDHPRVNATATPSSQGGVEAARRQGQANANHQTDPRYDTADFSDPAPGNLRTDYVLPSNTLRIVGGGVYWPTEDQPGHDWIDVSDHRLVWIDVSLGEE